MYTKIHYILDYYRVHRPFEIVDAVLLSSYMGIACNPDPVCLELNNNKGQKSFFHFIFIYNIPILIKQLNIVPISWM